MNSISDLGALLRGRAASELRLQPTRESSPYLGTALALIVVIVVIDIVVGPAFRLSTLLVLPPLIAALGCSSRETLFVALASFVAALGVAITNENFGDANFYARFLGIALANTVAVFIAVLRGQLQAERARAVLMANAGVLLEETLEWDATLAKITQLAVPALCDGASIDIFDAEREAITSVATIGATLDLARRVDRIREGYEINPSSDHPVAAVLRGGQTLLLPGVDDRDAMEKLVELGPGYREALTRSRIRAALVVPLRARGRMLGTLTLISFRGADFDPDDRAVAEDLARRAAYALDNARRHRGQAHIADVLQRSLRPDAIPATPGLVIAARFLPAGEQNEVGGDFYDVIPLADGSVVAVIGDVSGKGAEAATVTAIARNTLRSEPLDDLTPAEALTRLNTVLFERLGDGRFCTAAYVRITPTARGANLRISLGGHPHPLVVRADGSVDELGRLGTLLGGFAVPDLADTEATLAPGETLLLYTDGALETRGRERTGSRGSVEFVAEDLALTEPGMDVAAIAELVELNSLQRQHGHLRDDIALLAISPEA